MTERTNHQERSKYVACSFASQTAIISALSMALYTIPCCICTNYEQKTVTENFAFLIRGFLMLYSLIYTLLTFCKRYCRYDRLFPVLNSCRRACTKNGQRWTDCWWSVRNIHRSLSAEKTARKTSNNNLFSQGINTH